jgi:chemotaxis protein histidine kinase CheA
MAIPEELVQQFRTVAQERLAKIEAAWAQVLSALDEEAAVLLHRELHTLKGESKMLGFSDVNLVCHKLEDLLEVARARGYAVDEDVDLAVNMAVRFMAMLVRKKVGAQLGGIDLPGFVKQIDLVVAELSAEPKQRMSGITPFRPSGAGPRIPTALRSRLAMIATNVFIEYSSARGLRRERLRPSWHTLRDLIAIHRAVIGAGQLAKHKTGAQTLARELGKQVELLIDIESIEATAEMLTAIDASLLHLIRNALDHGIELPADRVAAGKPEEGRVRLTCGVKGNSFRLTVSDDGRGVSMEEVRARAIDFGMIKPNEEHVEDRWLDIVCHPGFTTKAEASDVSGRGVGLDAVRIGIHEVGGTLTASTKQGRGTTWQIEIPVPNITFDAHIFRLPNIPFPIVLEGDWQAVEGAQHDAIVLDVAQTLGLTEQRSVEPVRYFQRGDKTIGILSDQPPKAVSARRLVSPPPPAFAEVVVVENTECLLAHFDRQFR